MRFVLQQTEEINYGASHKGRPVKNRKHAECRSISKQKCQEILGKVTPRSVGRSRNIDKKKRQIGERVAIIVFLRMNAIVRQFVRFPPSDCLGRCSQCKIISCNTYCLDFIENKCLRRLDSPILVGVPTMHNSPPPIYAILQKVRYTAALLNPLIIFSTVFFVSYNTAIRFDFHVNHVS